MQIINKGSTNLADTVKANDQILVRFSEYSLMDKVVTVSNLDYAEVVDEFNYRVVNDLKIVGYTIIIYRFDISEYSNNKGIQIA